jgi:NTP pyrophosphatase (non-canonical NTP hydrolase)
MSDSDSVFANQARFMKACGQTTQGWNEDQFVLYLELIHEEALELFNAVEDKNRTEIFDGLLDLIVVAIGAGLSAGFPMADGWKEVMRSNMDKIDPVTGMVLRREDGKILKGPNWQPPKLADLLG